MSASVKTILVLGPWSSGSTAITGYLARRGAWTCPPHQMTNDPLTPDSHESQAFRDALCASFHELTLEPMQPISKFTNFFRDFVDQQRARAAAMASPAILLKHPIAALALPQILSVVPAEVIVVLRPIKQIERSRKRRGWHPIYGQEGAQRIYGTAFSNLIAAGKSFTAVSYPEFLSDQKVRDGLASSLGLSFDPFQRRASELWLRRPVPTMQPLQSKEEMQ